MLRSILHFRQLNLAVILGVAVAGATLTGALMVGDSVKQSLRALTFERLGQIEYVALPQYLLGADLGKRLSEAHDGPVAQALLLRGGADADGRRASRVAIQGVDEAFFDLFENGAGLNDSLERKQGQFFASALVNQRLADELGLQVGQDMVLSFPKNSAIHRDSLYGRKETEDVIQKLRVTVRALIPDEGIGRFSLTPHQDVPFNVFVARNVLARTMDKEDGANTLLMGGTGDAETVKARLRGALSLSDLNLKIRKGPDYIGLETPGFFFNDELVQRIETIASHAGFEIEAISTYLVNRIESQNKMVPYSLMTALDADPNDIEGRFPKAKGEAAINAWTAENLGVKLGDKLRLSYFVVGADESLEETQTEVTLTGILSMDGLGSDRDLTPLFPGAEDADDLNAWDPTFPMDMSLIRDEDETYWDDYHTAPKVFLSQEQAREMWESRFGFVTGLRFVPKQISLDFGLAVLEKALVEQLEPETAGLSLMAIKADGMDASKGATDFTGLFIALSFFIIASACLLIALFFRLLVSGRMSEVGILGAMGFTAKAVRGRFLKEGLILASVGAVLGSLGGILYAEAVMAGLRNFWDIGTRHLYFYFNPLSLCIGIILTLLAALGSIAAALRVLRQHSLVSLVSGSAGDILHSGGTRWVRAFWISLLIWVSSGVAALLKPELVWLGFVTGAALFVWGLAALGRYLYGTGSAAGLGGSMRLALRNTGRQAGRSLLSVTLVAAAVFTIVAVGLYRNTGEVDSDAWTSGAGGYFLSASAEVPLHAPLGNKAKRDDLSLSDASLAELDLSGVISMRVRPGDDASCLNLFAPRQPRILGLGEARSFDGRFPFQAHLGEDGVDPWSLLEEPLEDGAIPIIGDFNSVMWIMKSGLGKTYTIQNSLGEDVPLRFVALLKGSIFQSELIMSQANFQKLFPEVSGYGFFLFDSQSSSRDGLLNLEADLSGYGFDMTETKATIKAFHAIENTYISIFQMLGGLGLLLGTLGLGAIIYRNAMERRGEMAVMRAFGFRQQKIGRMLVIENGVLILWGIAVGAASAVVSMLPHLLATKVDTSWSLLGGTLLGVFIVGILSTWFASRKASRFPLLESLRSS